MATSLGERKIRIQTNFRPGEGWALLGTSCPRQAIWVVLPQPNRFTGSIEKNWSHNKCLVSVQCRENKCFCTV